MCDGSERIQFSLLADSRNQINEIFDIQKCNLVLRTSAEFYVK